MLILVVEASTSAAKAMLFDAEKGVIAVESVPYTPDMDKDGRQDTEKVYLSTLNVGHKVAAGRDIAAIAVAGVWHSIAVCDNAMRPVVPTHCWTFTQARTICRRIRDDRELSYRIYDRTGCMPNVTYQPYTLMYLKENGLDLKDKLFASQAGYNFFRMTGERLETANITSGMGLINTHERNYDEFVLDLAGIRQNQLGQLVGFKDACSLTTECARALGISPGIPVIPPHSDGALNQIGSGATQTGMMTFSVGTSAAIRLSSVKPILPAKRSTWCYVGVLDWLCGGATTGACSCVNWFKDTVLQNKWDFAQLESELLKESAGPVFLPFLLGERCPGWNDERTGGFYDLKADTTVPQMFRAILEGILFNVYQCYLELIEINGIPERIIMSGGILNSKAWSQMAANIFDTPVLLAENSQASLLGGAALALHVAGALKDIRDFSRDNPQILYPQEGASELYREKYHNYLYCYNQLIEKF